MYYLLYPVAIGIFSGLIYGFFFAFQQRRACSHVIYSLFSTVRIIILALFWFYLLPWQTISFILVMIGFGISFWLTLLFIGINRTEYHGWF